MSVCRTYPVRGMCDALGLCFDEPFSRVGTATTAVCENAASISMLTASSDIVISLALIHARWTVYRCGQSPSASIWRWRSIATMHRQPHRSPSLFQCGSQSSTSLHDFITILRRNRRADVNYGIVCYSGAVFTNLDLYSHGSSNASTRLTKRAQQCSGEVCLASAHTKYPSVTLRRYCLPFSSVIYDSRYCDLLDLHSLHSSQYIHCRSWTLLSI
jgi:hypothetical protein